MPARTFWTHTRLDQYLRKVAAQTHRMGEGSFIIPGYVFLGIPEDPTVSEPHSDKRNAERRTVFGLGIVTAPEIRTPCVIRDLSSTGAKLGIPRQVQLPTEFKVTLLKTSTTRRVLLKWRRGDFAGVEFHPRRGV